MDAATGCISIPREALANSLVNCAAFRNWSGDNWTVEQAAEHVFQQALPEEGEHYLNYADRRPFAVIFRPPGSNVLTRGAAPRNFVSSGRLVVELHWSPPPLDGEDPGRNVRTFENFIGSLLSTGDAESPGILDLSGIAGYLNISRVEVIGPHRVDSANVSVVGDCYIAYLDIDWGVRA